MFPLSIDINEGTFLVIFFHTLVTEVNIAQNINAYIEKISSSYGYYVDDLEEVGIKFMETFEENKYIFKLNYKYSDSCYKLDLSIQTYIL